MPCVPSSSSCIRYGGGERCDPAGQVWHCLKCYKLQKELVDANFSNHDIVQKVMYQHLKTNVVLKSVYDRDMAALNKKIDDLSKTVQILSSRNKKQYYEVKTDFEREKSIAEKQATQIAKDRWIYERQSLEAKANSDTTTSNLKALKARKEAKQSDPFISEEVLNELFPFVVRTTDTVAASSDARI